MFFEMFVQVFVMEMEMEAFDSSYFYKFYGILAVVKNILWNLVKSCKRSKSIAQF